MSPVSKRSAMLVGGSAYAQSVRDAQRRAAPSFSEERQVSVEPHPSHLTPDVMAQQLAEDPEFIALVRAERAAGVRSLW